MNKLSAIEKEVVSLLAVHKMIDDMVNYEVFCKNNSLIDINLIFKIMNHKRVFNLLLSDFLSLPPAEPFDFERPQDLKRESEKSYLYFLNEICQNPQLMGDVNEMKKIINNFSEWLDCLVCVDGVWFPSISTEVNFKVSRIFYIKICGNISKHNFSRLSRDMKKIMNILKEHNVNLGERHIFLVLEDFYEWFYNNVFSYHASTIACFLNDIRWGIYTYLRNEFVRSFSREGEIAYSFDVPAGLKDLVVRAMYWDLMNTQRTRPYFPRFTVSPSFSNLY
ncbi:MAG: hypothetical protein ABID63_02305 [Pseudomonadota bacterium]